MNLHRLPISPSIDMFIFLLHQAGCVTKLKGFLYFCLFCFCCCCCCCFQDTPPPPPPPRWLSKVAHAHCPSKNMGLILALCYKGIEYNYVKKKYGTAVCTKSNALCRKTTESACLWMHTQWRVNVTLHPGWLKQMPLIGCYGCPCCFKLTER